MRKRGKDRTTSDITMQPCRCMQQLQ